MKKIILAMFVLVFLAGFAHADKLTLNSSQTAVSPITTVLDWRNVNIDLSNRNNILTVIYFKLNAAGQRIPMENGKVRRTWICRNKADDSETPADESSTCWTDVFMFAIRTQDVGTSIGRGLRQLILNQMKQDPTVFDAGNDGTFDD
jgi:hypothetical protein